MLLAERLKANPVGTPINEELMEILHHLYSESEAMVGGKFPMTPMKLEEIVSSTGIAKDELEKTLQSMIHKGLVLNILESGHWPEYLVPIATSHMKAFAVLRASDINWTYFSPPMLIEPGERTGNSKVSFEDYAVAQVDELEKPAHERSRFTIGY